MVSMGRVAEPVKRRPYRSPLRDERARASRGRIIDAAAAQFLDRGYAATTVAAVAAQAGVSQDLVFRVFATKRGLLKAVLDVGIGGDDAEVAVLDRAGPQALRDEPSLRRQIALFAAGISAQLTRVRPLDDMLRSAAAVEPELAALRADIQLRQRREAMTTAAGWLHGPLRPEIDAAGVLWTLTSPEVHHMLVENCGWSVEQYREWLQRTLEASLLPE